MLIIARHGQSDDSHYHNRSGLRAALAQGVDIISLSSRLTKDNQLVLARYAHFGNDRREPLLRAMTLKELRRRTAGSKQPVTTLLEALKTIDSDCLVDIEINERAAVEPLLTLLHPWLRKKSDWSAFIFSSRSPFVLSLLRKHAPKALLALVHRRNPLTFLAWQPLLQLSAVGFHRLHVNSVVIDAAHTLDLLTYAYTIDRPKAAKKLAALGIDAIVTDNPEKF